MYVNLYANLVSWVLPLIATESELTNILSCLLCRIVPEDFLTLQMGNILVVADYAGSSDFLTFLANRTISTGVQFTMASLLVCSHPCSSSLEVYLY